MIQTSFRFGVLKIFAMRLGGPPHYHKWNVEIYVPGIWHNDGHTWLDMVCAVSLTWNRWTRGFGLRVFGFGAAFTYYPVRP